MGTFQEKLNFNATERFLNKLRLHIWFPCSQTGLWRCGPSASKLSIQGHTICQQYIIEIWIMAIFPAKSPPNMLFFCSMSSLTGSSFFLLFPHGYPSNRTCSQCTEPVSGQQAAGHRGTRWTHAVWCRWRILVYTCPRMSGCGNHELPLSKITAQTIILD